MLKYLPVIFVVVSAMLAGCAGAAPSSDQPSQITVKDAWARPVVASGDANGATYLIIENKGGPDRLISVSGDVADMFEVQETKEINGMMSMQEVEGGLEIPANMTVTLKPAGLHIMMMKIRRDVKPGDTFKLTLKFQSGLEIPVDVMVREA
ncbi:MAG: copper chaperone PCu(A)C [Chloroflexi bacterium]|nr:copper chaperone PCu(A)C [Chloroflexota bacterium]